MLLREMYHGQWWRTDQLYQTPMIAMQSYQVFRGDFFTVVYPTDTFGMVTAKVISLYTRVGNSLICSKRVETFGFSGCINPDVEMLISLDDFCRSRCHPVCVPCIVIPCPWFREIAWRSAHLTFCQQFHRRRTFSSGIM